MTCNDINNPHPLLVATGQECRSRRAADGAIGMEIGKGQALRGHAINLGGLDPSIKKAGVSISQIIGQNDYDVGSASRFILADAELRHCAASGPAN